jgi:ABC-type glycerol-3-phosphate transport system substrate-binding protein
MKTHHERALIAALIGASCCAGSANAELDAVTSTVTHTSGENTMNQAATDRNEYVGM